MATPFSSTGELAGRRRASYKPLITGLLVLVCFGIAGLGCRRDPLGKVHGQVSFQGKPIAAGIVGFKNLQTRLHITANVDQQGRYEVSMAKGYGLPPGDYEVAVYPFVADLPIGSTERPVVREFKDIPPKYRKPETSGLLLTVKAGDNPYNIDMQP